MYRALETFLEKMIGSFRRIAHATKNEMTVGDLQSEAWLVAEAIGKRRGLAIDFADPDDANLILSAVYVKNVKRGDWHMRKSIRIDRQDEDNDDTICWSDLLPARASSDPLISLLERESGFNAEAILRSSFSQAAAYVAVFYGFDYDRQEICTYLVISDYVLMRRVSAAADHVRIQPSLFDRIARISANFVPAHGRQYAVRIEPCNGSTQWGWQFDEPTQSPVNSYKITETPIF